MITVVIPCLNEEQTLADTCRSLGFGIPGRPRPADARLILVDNGSTDNTLEVARQVRAESAQGSVLIGSEAERGYVPPRARGAQIAGQLMDESNEVADAVFILQADADTQYDAGYIEAMRDASERHGRGLLFNARSEWPHNLPDSFCSLARHLESVDNAVDSADFPDSDVVVDDKCCGYWLSDYLSWGGHQREFDSRGDEVHAETTRLYMRAKALGGARLLVEDAIARHSIRRWQEHPLKEFASAGFPRGRTWQDRWTAGSERSIPDFSGPLDDIWAAALAERHRHLVALFQLLPMHVTSSLLVPKSIESCRPPTSYALPRRAVEDLRRHPALLLEDVFRAVGIG